MTKNDVRFEFVQYQSVRIKKIESEGFVFSRMNNADGMNEYKVSYWMDGKKQQ